MTCKNGQLADQNTFNNAFVSRIDDTSTVGKIDLLNDESTPIYDIQGEVNNIISDIADHESRITTNTNDIATHEIRLDNHDTELLDHENRIDALETSQASQDTSITDLQTTKANLASPTFTGNPLAPTQSISDNSTKIATTEFVHDLFDTISSFSGEGIDLKSTGVAQDKILVTDGANNFVYKFLWELMGLDVKHFDRITATIPTATYTELVASTSAEIKKMDFSDSYGTAIGIYKGASGSEVQIGFVSLGGGSLEFRNSIPSGTRISIKSLTSDLTGNEFNFHLLG